MPLHNSESAREAACGLASAVGERCAASEIEIEIEKEIEIGTPERTRAWTLRNAVLPARRCGVCCPCETPVLDLVWPGPQVLGTLEKVLQDLIQVVTGAC